MMQTGEPTKTRYVTFYVHITTIGKTISVEVPQSESTNLDLLRKRIVAKAGLRSASNYKILLNGKIL